MTRKCPECGENLPDEAHFCANCGHDFKDKNSMNPIKNRKIFIVLIIAILAVGSVMLFGISNNSNTNQIVPFNKIGDDSLEFTITEVNGYRDNYGEEPYSIMAAALFTKVPSDLDGYIIKTTYHDKDGKQVAKVVESLSNVIFEETADYPQAFGYYFTYEKLEPEYITVEIVKDKKTLQNVTFEVDKNNLEYL